MSNVSLRYFASVWQRPSRKATYAFRLLHVTTEGNAEHYLVLACGYVREYLHPSVVGLPIPKDEESFTKWTTPASVCDAVREGVRSALHDEWEDPPRYCTTFPRSVREAVVQREEADVLPPRTYPSHIVRLPIAVPSMNSDLDAEFVLRKVEANLTSGGFKPKRWRKSPCAHTCVLAVDRSATLSVAYTSHTWVEWPNIPDAHCAPIAFQEGMGTSRAGVVTSPFPMSKKRHAIVVSDVDTSPTVPAIAWQCVWSAASPKEACAVLLSALRSKRVDADYAVLCVDLSE